MLRFAAGYGAIACALPYLALKVIWLAGGDLGVSDAAMMRDPSMVALNAATLVMDLIAIGIALALTHAWGQRIPAWLVLPPAWVALGLLVRFVGAVPVATMGRMFTGRSVSSAPGPVQPWVYALVYAEFVGMGIGLALAFVLYARARWSWVLESSMPRGATHSVLVPLANAAALMAAAVGIVNLAWAVGVSVGLPSELVARRTFSSHVVNAVDGAAMTAAAVGVLMMVHRAGGRTSPWVPLALAWVGSGFLFAWGLWGLVNVVGNTALVRGRPDVPSWVDLLSVAQLIAGLVIGLVVLVLLAERAATRAARSQR